MMVVNVSGSRLLGTRVIGNARLLSARSSLAAPVSAGPQAAAPLLSSSLGHQPLASSLRLRGVSTLPSRSWTKPFEKDLHGTGTRRSFSTTPVCKSDPKGNQSTIEKPEQKKGTDNMDDRTKQLAGLEDRPASNEAADTGLGLTNSLLNVAAPITVALTIAVTSPVLLVWRGIKRLTNRPLDMRNKVVMVTGASSGIGMHISYQYAELGARLALVARREEKLDAVAQACRAKGSPDVFVVQADLGTQDGCRKAIEATMQYYDRLDCLVLNAGLIQIYKFEQQEETEGFASIMDVNFWGYVFSAKYALPYLRQSGGQLVVNDSIAEFIPEPSMSLYNASKAAVSQFFETLRLEMGNEVPITIFQPGVIKSEMTDGKTVPAGGGVSSTEEAPDLRKEAGFGLFPTVPTPYLAKGAVAAARRRQPRAVIPGWYSSMLYLRLLSPELFRAMLGYLFRGQRTPARAAQDAMGGGFKAPSGADLREGGATSERK